LRKFSRLFLNLKNLNIRGYYKISKEAVDQFVLFSPNIYVKNFISIGLEIFLNRIVRIINNYIELRYSTDLINLERQGQSSAGWNW
jgi:hypothetical protein